MSDSMFSCYWRKSTGHEARRSNEFGYDSSIPWAKIIVAGVILSFMFRACGL